MAEREDVIRALELVNKTILQTVERITPQALKYLEMLQDQDDSRFWRAKPIKGFDESKMIPRKFTYQQFADYLGLHRKSVYTHLKNLEINSYLILDDSKKPHKLQLMPTTDDTVGKVVNILKKDTDSVFQDKGLPEGWVTLTEGEK
jgi:hypothetical protein